ncbi:hypothetical protein [Microbacterium sp. Leaf320]|uniref:DUF7662 domain-containing protein n=1 Tax=Microbacterium sp. Leaf320 TaxID=1736334 RepID=UPI0006F4A2B1|nr:hypothetical protein [Microbacterium sp. Leaf320]KQQ68462.1 hypothetical protein ASF63_00130 [Microbacterium sp. Leaf320]
MALRDHHEVQMGPYAPLYDYLRTHEEAEEVLLSFVEIEAILGRALPDAARTPGEGWWSGHPTRLQARSWLAAWRRPDPRYDDLCVAFRRTGQLTKPSSEDQSRQIKMYLRHAWDMLDFEIQDAQECVVYLIHFEEPGLYKVGISKASTSRPQALARAGGIVRDTVRVKNRTLARLLESECLVRVDAARTEPPIWIAQWAGATEFWSDDVSLPPFREILESLNDELPIAYRGAWA